MAPRQCLLRLLVESALEGSLDMAETYYRESMATALHEAQGLARRLGRSKRELNGQKALIKQKRAEYSAASVQLYDAEGGPLERAEADGLNPNLREPPSTEFIEQVLQHGESTEVVAGPGGELLRAAVRIERDLEVLDALRRVRPAPRPVSHSDAVKAVRRRLSVAAWTPRRI